nr:hypothetical protein [Tanacetum cinerariifolium]
MAFQSITLSSRFPQTNNQLRTLSNPRNQATIQDRRVTVQTVQGTHIQGYGKNGTRTSAKTQGANKNGVQEIPTPATFQINDLDAFDSDCDDVPSAKEVLMANLSSYDSDILSEDLGGVEHIKGAFEKDVKPFDQTLKEYFQLFERGLHKKLKEMNSVFIQKETEVAKYSVDKKYFEIEKKELGLDNDRLLEHIISQDVIMLSCMLMFIMCFVDEYEENLKLQTELANMNDMIEKAVYNELSKKCQLEAKNVSIAKLKEHIANLKGKNTIESVQNVHNSNVVTSKVYKLDLPPLSPYIKNNMAAHVDYLKHTQANTNILHKIIEDARKLRPLDSNLASASDVLEIYMKQLWATIKKVKRSPFYQFVINNKTCQIDVKIFREVLDICPRVENQEFDIPPPSEFLVEFLLELGYKGEPEKRQVSKKIRIPKNVVIQEPPSVPVKNIKKSSRKLKGIEFLSTAAQLEIDIKKAQKASRRQSRFQHQFGGSSEGASLKPEIPDDPIGNLQSQIKELVLHQRFQIKQKKTVEHKMTLMTRVPLKIRKNVAKTEEEETANSEHGEDDTKDKEVFESYGQTVSLKRNHEEYKDEDPSAGPNQVKEPEHEVQIDLEELTFKNVANDADEPHADPKPKIQKKGQFKDSSKNEVLNPEWNTVKVVGDTPKQPWFNQMVQVMKPSLIFDKLMSTPIEFLAFSMISGNKERTYSSSIKKAPAARAMMNTMSKHKVLSTMRIISVISVQVEKKEGYGYLKEIVVRRADQNLYKFKKGDLPDLHLNDIKDMLLLVAQNKLYNLDANFIVDFVTGLKMFIRGIILKNKVKDVQLEVKSYQRKLNLTRPQRSCSDISANEPYTPNYDP